MFGRWVHMVGEHAVVLGAGMAGLLTARVLTEFYEKVTLVERDRLTDPEANPERGRRGVPQGLHAHLLLARGKQALEDLFPGLTDELIAAGAVPIEALKDFRFCLAGHEVRRAPVGEFLSMTRPFLEEHVRRRVVATSEVRFVDGCDVTGLAATGDTNGGVRVTGARVVQHTAGAEEVLDADLVVDAMGRAARSPAWLRELGYAAPPTDELQVNIGYASRLVRLSAEALGTDRAMLIGPRPGLSRALALFKVEDDRWLLTLVGYAGPPPTDEEGYLAFAETVAPPDVFDAIRAARPLTEIRSFRFPASRRRRYERLRRFPPGLLVTGDAICSFNPIYGQGMSVATLQAFALRRALAKGERDLARRFFRAVSGVVAPAWQLGINADLAIPEIEAPRPLSFRLVNAYVRRVQRATGQNDNVATTFFRVTGLDYPIGRLLRPTLAWQVLGARGAASESAPEQAATLR